MIPVFPRCGPCPRIRLPVPFSGPTPCRIVLIGENGARTEDEQGIPFCGKTGQELDSLYLPLLGLPRDSVFIMNAMRCSHKDYHNPTPDEAMACASVHLGETLALVRPQIVVPMGAVACSLFGITDMIQEHGIPRPGRWGSWSGIVFPTYHPSAGMKPGGTGFMIALTRDFHELGLLVKSLPTRPTRVVNKYTDPSYTIDITRNSEWGNDWSHLPNSSAKHHVGSREESIILHSRDVRSKSELMSRIRRELRGQVLGCVCKPKSCHGDTLAQIADEFDYPTDPYPSPDYRVCRTPGDVNDYFQHFLSSDDWTRDNPHPELGEDTESLPDGSPFCVTFSLTPGTGRLIYVGDAQTLARYRELRTALGFHSIFHNYLHDVEVYDALGLPIAEFTDTMVRAYNLCLGGGGDDEEESRAGRGSLSLKILAYRHLAMRMTSFKDTVYPHSIPKVMDWLWEAERLFRPEDRKTKRCTCGHIQNAHEAKGKTQRRTGSCCVCDCDKYRAFKFPPVPPEAKALNQLYLKITNLITSIESNTVDSDGKPVDPWKRIKGWPDEDSPLSMLAAEEMESALGPPPAPSIAHVPEAELVVYACRDADASLRLKLFLDTYKPWIWHD